MPFGQFSSLWRSVLSKSRFPTKHWHSSSSRVVGDVESDGRAWRNGWTGYDQLAVRGIFLVEKVRRGPGTLPWGSCSPVRWWRDNDLCSRKRRSLHSYARDGDRQRQVRKSSPWISVLSREKAAREKLNGKRYSEEVKACERRLVQLYREGKLSLDGLASVVRQQCGEWQALFVVVGFVARLATEAMTNHDRRFFLEKMDAFLFTLSTHPRHEKAKCERLQPLVTLFKDSMEALSTKSVLYTLKILAYINCPSLSLCGLMLGVERLYGRKLHDLSPEDLLWLADASSRISNRNGNYNCVALCGDLWKEFSSRLADFPPPKAVQMLNSLAFGSPKDQTFQNRIGRTFHDVEDYLAPSMSCLKLRELAQLANSFCKFGYKARSVSFRDILFDRMRSFKHAREIGDMFHYVSVCGAVDEALLRRLGSYISEEVVRYNNREIQLLMLSLALPSVVDIPGCAELAHLLGEEIVRRMSNNRESLSPVQCARLVYAFFRLNMSQSQAVNWLFSNTMRDFQQLPQREMTQFVYGVSQLKENRKYVAHLHDTICRTNIREKQLTLDGGVLICKAFVGMQVVHEPWLEEVVRCSRRDLPTLMLKKFKAMSIVLRSLSLLAFPSAELFEDVKAWLATHVTLVATYGWSVGMVSILWASVMQSVFPYKTLKQLCCSEPPAIGQVEEEVLVQLHQLWIILRQQCRMDMLPPSTYLALVHRISQVNRLVLHEDVHACVKDIVHLFPSGHVRVDVLTAEGVRIHCGLLKNRDGKSTAWPDTVGEEPSALEVQRLQERGYQPLAVQVFPSAWLDLSQNPLGPAVGICRVLKACGWDVLCISRAEYVSAADKDRFVHAEFMWKGEDIGAVKILAEDDMTAEKRLNKDQRRSV